MEYEQKYFRQKKREIKKKALTLRCFESYQPN